MATLAGGAFITSINGKRCTAVPKTTADAAKANVNVATEAADTTTAAAENVAQTTTEAAAVAAATTTAEDENSTSTTNNTPPALVNDPPPQQVQASALVPPAALEQSSSPDPPSAITSAIPTFTQIPTSPSQTGKTDSINAAPTTQTIAYTTTLQQETALADASSSLAPSDSATQLFTTIGTADGPSNSAAAAATGSSSSTNGAFSAVPVSTNNNEVQSTVAVAGGVIGGVLSISMVAFFIWWWRRRAMKKRRSTLLTPLTIDNALGPDEKAPYAIERGSIGPTPRAERFKAALGYNIRKFHGSVSRVVARGTDRGSTTTPSVNMNRGNSQFIEPTTANNRPGSSGATGRGADVTAKDRFLDWWGRVTADVSFNWRLKGKSRDSDELFGPGARGIAEKGPGGGRGAAGTQPDFLTLLGMDDRELDREAQRRRMSASRLRSDSASSSDNFLGGLNLDFGRSDDPFSDANAIAHTSAKPAPLALASQANNDPFSDTNAIPSAPKPTTYVSEVRRERGPSLGGAAQRPPSSVAGGGYRESGASVESFGTRRNKFRSDPFDLERPELLGRTGGSVSSSTGATIGSNGRISGLVGGTGDVRRPAGAHTRADSFTSKYSSGISLGDWSDPGPDVGPAAARGGGWEGPETRESPTQGWRNRLERESVARKGEKRQSGGSQNSVGKAM